MALTGASEMETSAPYGPLGPWALGRPPHLKFMAPSLAPCPMLPRDASCSTSNTCFGSQQDSRTRYAKYYVVSCQVSTTTTTTTTY